MRRLAAVLVIGLMLLPALAMPVSAHPLGNFTVNRSSALEIGPGTASMRYVLDLAEIPTLQELSAAGLSSTPTAAERATLLAAKAPGLVEGLSLSLDGTPVEWRIRSSSLDLLPGQAGLWTLRLVLDLTASPNRVDGPLEYHDGTFAGRTGWHQVILRAVGDTGLRQSSAPTTDMTNELRQYPTDPSISPPDINSASAFVLAGGGASSASGTGASATVPRFGVEGASDQLTAFLRAGPLSDVAGLLGALLIAAALGAFHAVTPGHGKTVMAAYLVGTQGTRQQALLLGLSVAVSHTLGVLVLGAVILAASSLFAPERVYPYLSAASGLIVLGIGLWLLRTRIQRHDGHGHTHGPVAAHGHHHDHDKSSDAGLGWKSLVVLGLSGGIVPSASALLLLLAAVNVHQIGLGIVLIAVFGLGMAAVLVGVGMTLVGAGALAARRLARYRLAPTLMARLPLLTAVVVVVFGVGITVQAVAQFLPRG